MVDSGLLTDDQLDAALDEHKRTGRPLGEVVVTLGFASAGAVGNALAEQHGGPLKTEYGMSLGLRARLGADGAAEIAPERDEAEQLLAEVLRLRERTGALQQERLVDARKLEAAKAAERAAREQLEALTTGDGPPPVDPTELDQLRRDRDGILARASELQAAVQSVLRAHDAAVSRLVQLEASLAPADAEPPPADSHVLLVPSTSGYLLIEREGPPPAVGVVLELSAGASPKRHTVLRVAQTRARGRAEVCAYLSG